MSRDDLLFWLSIVWFAALLGALVWTFVALCITESSSWFADGSGMTVSNCTVFFACPVCGVCYSAAHERSSNSPGEAAYRLAILCRRYAILDAVLGSLAKR
jgi:hypothetical protein